MEWNKDRKGQLTRIIIGQADTGETGVKKPVRVLSLRSTTTEEVYDIIKKALDNAMKK